MENNKKLNLEDLEKVNGGSDSWTLKIDPEITSLGGYTINQKVDFYWDYNRVGVITGFCIDRSGYSVLMPYEWEYAQVQDCNNGEKIFFPVQELTPHQEGAK